LINDPRVLSIPDRDNGEPVVSLLDIDPQRIVLPSALIRKIDGIVDSPNMVARVGVRQGLIEVLKALNEKNPNLGLVLIEGYRTPGVQRIEFGKEIQRIKTKYPDWGPEELAQKASHYVANPDVYAPHTTGGALDLSIWDLRTRDYLDMGNWFTHDETAETQYSGLQPSQLENRRLLMEAMTAGGFSNYMCEWWHFCLGDKLDAFLKGENFAVYGPINNLPQ
jgi:D-alanyl-D-alanine dipeptidase